MALLSVVVLSATAVLTQLSVRPDLGSQPDLSGLHVQGGYYLSLDRVQGRKDAYRAKLLIDARYGHLGNWEVVGEGSLTHRDGGVYVWNMYSGGRPQQTETMALFNGRLIPTRLGSQYGSVELNLRRPDGKKNVRP